MRGLLDRTAVTAAGYDLTVADLALAGLRSGTWQEFEARVVAGLEREGGELPEGALRTAAVAWRRERGLIAGDELAAWLTERELEKDEWTACLRRSVLRDCGAPATHTPSPDEILAVLRAEALCDGILTGLASETVTAAGAAKAIAEAANGDGAAPDVAAVDQLVAAARDAVTPLRDLPDLEERAARIVALQDARERFVAERVRPTDVERLLTDRRLDWAMIAWHEAAFTTEAAAREAAMLVREDGLSLEEAATVADAPLTHAVMRLGEVGGELGPLLVAAGPGDLIGPRTGEGVSRLIAVLERTAPASSDAELVGRAKTELLSESLTRHLAGQVVWHGAV